MDTYHRWMEGVILASMGGIPVINLPVGSDALGRPMGMQIMGRFGEDNRVLEFALAYDERIDQAWSLVMAPGIKFMQEHY